MISEVSAAVCTVLTGTVILFQACLAAGAPWGAASMGGKFPGKYPPAMRIAAVANMLILMCIAAIVLTRAGLIFPDIMPLSKTAIWFVVVFFAAGTIMNTITPSRIERIWAPVALFQCITSIMVALG